MGRRKSGSQAQIQHGKPVSGNKLLYSKIKTLRSFGLRTTTRDLGKVLLLCPSFAVCYGGENDEK